MSTTPASTCYIRLASFSNTFTFSALHKHSHETHLTPSYPMTACTCQVTVQARYAGLVLYASCSRYQPFYVIQKTRMPWHPTARIFSMFTGQALGHLRWCCARGTESNCDGWLLYTCGRPCQVAEVESGQLVWCDQVLSIGMSIHVDAARGRHINARQCSAGKAHQCM